VRNDIYDERRPDIAGPRVSDLWRAIFSWRHFVRYRHETSALTLDATIRIARGPRRGWATLVLVLVLLLPALQVFAGTDQLGNPKALGVSALIWTIVLEMPGRAHRRGASPLPSRKWFFGLTAIEILVFCLLNVGHDPPLANAVAGSRFLSGVAWGAGLASAADLGRSLAAFLLRLRRGEPLYSEIPGDPLPR
jgi:hypothetical protein